MRQISTAIILILISVSLAGCSLIENQTKVRDRLVGIMSRADQELKRKNYDEAIRLYDSALKLSPNEPTCMSARALAYRIRGAEHYNASIKLEPTEREKAMESARRDMLKAAEDANSAVNILKNSPYIKFYDTLTKEDHFLYSAAIRADCLAVVATVVDKNRAEEALQAAHEYIDADTIPDRIKASRLAAGKMLLNTQNGDKALIEYKTVLDQEPDNIEALLGVGLSLSQSGDSEKFQEAKKYLKRFIELAPDDHPMKADVLNTLKYSESK